LTVGHILKKRLNAKTILYYKFQVEIARVLTEKKQGKNSVVKWNRPTKKKLSLSTGASL